MELSGLIWISVESLCLRWQQKEHIGNPLTDLESGETMEPHGLAWSLLD